MRNPYGEMEQYPLPSVVTVKVRALRQRGYPSLVDWLKDPKHLYIGRSVPWVKGAEKPSIWANPYTLKKHTLADALKLYEAHVRERLTHRLPELGQYTELGCWCHPRACHGDVLLKLYREYCMSSPNKPSVVSTQ